MNNTENKQLKYEKALEYEIFIKGEYNFARDKIQNSECIFDIWWHIWLFSQWCRFLNDKARIYYFEPIEKFYNKAKSTLWNDKNIILNNTWIGSESKNWTILANPEKTMQSSKYSSFLNPNWEIIECEFITLRDYLQTNNINKIDVLKMDIEWMEFEVLSSRWDLEWNKINNFIAEIHLLNDEMKSKRNQISQEVKNIFWNVKIISSWYREGIFLIWAYKEAWL